MKNTSKGNPFGTFYRLLGMMQDVSKEDIVRQYSGQDSLKELYKNKAVYNRMIADMEKSLGLSSQDPEMEHLQNRVIAAIAGYFDATGRYTDLTKTERMRKVKGTAEKAAGGVAFNKLTKKQLRKISYEFTNKQAEAPLAKRKIKNGPFISVTINKTIK